MDKWKEFQDKAEDYFNGGYNCCESVVMAVKDYAGIEDMMPVKIATPFGSGMSRNGGNCGALSAAFVSLGMLKGRVSPEDSRDLSYLPADRIYNRFKEQYGSILCRDITGVDLRDPEVAARNKERMHSQICGPIVRQVTAWVLDELEK